MRNFIIVGLIAAALIGPAAAQPAGSSASPAASSSLVDAQRDRLYRLGARLAVVNEKYHVFERLCNLATADQLDSIHKLRISPSQGKALLKAIQANLPQGAMDDAAMKEFRRKIQPEAERILGSEQFDRMIELVPSPKQKDQIEEILQEASNTPEGKAARQAADELAASLTAEQRQWAQPVLNLVKTSTGSTTTPPAKAGKPGAKKAVAKKTGDKAERRLLVMRTTSLGDNFAEDASWFDYGQHLTRRYRVEGADPSVLSAVSSSEGLPVRVLGTVHDDVLQVAGNSFSGAPPLQAAGGYNEVWRGQVPATVVSASPPTVSLDVGRARKLNARLDFQNPGEEQAFQKYAPNTTFLLGGTCLIKRDGANEQATMVDLSFADYNPARAPFDSCCLVQLSEDFLNHAAAEYLLGHQDELGGSNGNVSVKVSQLGATLRGCTGNQVRLYGRLSVAHTGLNVFDAEFEVVAQASMSGERMLIQPVPGTLQLRATSPLFWSAPKNWTDNLEAMLGQEYKSGLTLAVPEQFRDKILSAGVMQPPQLSGFQLFALNSGDRRTSLIAMGAPSAAAGAPKDALRSRIEDPGEFTLALSDEAVTSALRKAIPPMMPIVRPIPKEMQDQGGVKLTELEITELDMTFSNGLFQINSCSTAVHWSVALFSGVEPAFHFKGTARVSGAGNPLKTVANLQVESLEWLSPNIKGMPAADQQKMHDDLVKAMQEKALELPSIEPFAASMVGPKAALRLNRVSSSATPSEFLLHGTIDH